MLLNKKVALVTGAGQGLGAAIAQAFAEQGAQVAVADINADAADGVAAKINAAGGTAQGFACNVADRTAVKAMALSPDWGAGLWLFPPEMTSRAVEVEIFFANRQD